MNVFIPIYGLDGAGKSRLCNALLLQSQNSSREQQQVVSTATSAKILKPLPKITKASSSTNDNNNTQNQQLPYIKFPPITRITLKQRFEVDTDTDSDDDDDEKWKTENVFTPSYHKKQRQLEERQKPSAAPTGLIQQDSTASASGGVVDTDLPNRVPDQQQQQDAAVDTQRYYSPQEKQDESPSSSTSRSRMQNPLLSPKDLQEQPKNQNGRRDVVDRNHPTAITILDFSGSALLRGAWASNSVANLLFSSKSKTVKLVWCIDASASSSDRFRVMFSWSECLQLIRKLYCCTSSCSSAADGNTTISCCIVLFDNNNDADKVDYSAETESVTKLSKSFFSRQLCPELTINGLECEEDVEFEVVEASPKNVKDVVRFLLK